MKVYVSHLDFTMLDVSIGEMTQVTDETEHHAPHECREVPDELVRRFNAAQEALESISQEIEAAFEAADPQRWKFAGWAVHGHGRSIPVNRQCNDLPPELKSDLTAFGNCFWREIDGRKIRVEPASVQIVVNRDSGERRFVAQGEDAPLVSFSS